MNIGVAIGHNAKGNTGANGIRFEDDLTREVGKDLIAVLKANGHSVWDLTGNGRTLTERVAYSRTLPLDLVVSIHFNAFDQSASGTEVLYVSAKGKVAAEPILAAVAALGFTNRGVKYRDNLHVLNATKCTAVLVECCFCDSKHDMALYNKDKMVAAIYKGITGKTLVAAKPIVVKPKPIAKVLYRVITGSYAERANADAAIAKLKKAGFDSFIEVK